jgi:hypothetical protein
MEKIMVWLTSTVVCSELSSNIYEWAGGE